MRQTRPLPDTHPELTVIRWQGFTEYRVENWRLARDGSGRVIRGTSGFSWLDAAMLLLVAICVARGNVPALFSRRTLVCTAIAVTWLWVRFTQVLHESLLLFPALGIQLETHRGHPLVPWSLFVTRQFVPRSSLEDAVIYEGLRRWNVRFYLALLQRRRAPVSASDMSGKRGCIRVHVAYENTLPYFPVLKEIYLEVHQILFPQPTRISEDGASVQPYNRDRERGSRGVQ